MYLASECDKLETIVDGISQTSGANIVYKYHHHTGVETSYGGCHTSGYHVHVGDEMHNGGCYTDGYHVHSGCSQYSWKDLCRCKFDENNKCIKHEHRCSRCDQRNPGPSHRHYSCGDLPLNRWRMNCNGSPVNRWALGCGRREGEIESAQISFAPSGT